MAASWCHVLYSHRRCRFTPLQHSLPSSSRIIRRSVFLFLGAVSSRPSQSLQTVLPSARCTQRHASCVPPLWLCLSPGGSDGQMEQESGKDVTPGRALHWMTVFMKDLVGAVVDGGGGRNILTTFTGNGTINSLKGKRRGSLSKCPPNKRGNIRNPARVNCSLCLSRSASHWVFEPWNRRCIRVRRREGNIDVNKIQSKSSRTKIRGRRRKKKEEGESKKEVIEWQSFSYL